MNATTIPIDRIPSINHREGMALAATEYDRFVSAIERLDASDWSKPTANELWDVKAMVGHVVGMMKMNARLREMVRQQSVAAKDAKRTGGTSLDAMTALQVREHAGLTPDELVGVARETAPKALKGRSRIPAAMRALVPIDPGMPNEPKWKLGYLIDVILTRDPWMHRSDLAAATGHEMVLTADHDGRLIADVVREWAGRHGQPFTLVLTGPAGGTYTQGAGGERIELDAVEFCRTLSGRGSGAVDSPLLKTEVPF